MKKFPLGDTCIRYTLLSINSCGLHLLLRNYIAIMGLLRYTGIAVSIWLLHTAVTCYNGNVVHWYNLIAWVDQDLVLIRLGIDIVYITTKRSRWSYPSQNELLLFSCYLAVPDSSYLFFGSSLAVQSLPLCKLIICIKAFQWQLTPVFFSIPSSLAVNRVDIFKTSLKIAVFYEY